MRELPLQFAFCNFQFPISISHPLPGRLRVFAFNPSFQRRKKRAVGSGFIPAVPQTLKTMAGATDNLKEAKMRRLKPFHPSGLKTGVAGHSASAAGVAQPCSARTRQTPSLTRPRSQYIIRLPVHQTHKQEQLA